MPPADLDRLLDLLAELHKWSPAAGIAADDDYPAQLAATGHGLVSRADLDRITELHNLGAPPIQVQHGDPHLGNIVNTTHGLALIDFEFTALRPAGYDLAKLWVLIGTDAASRERVLTRLDAAIPSQVGFWVAGVLVLAREIVSHRRHVGLPARAHRLRRLASDLRDVLVRVRHLHRQLT